MDGEGFVRITGRMKDMIIRGGENVYPLEIEQILYTHPSVQDVQVRVFGCSYRYSQMKKDTCYKTKEFVCLKMARLYNTRLHKS